MKLIRNKFAKEVAKGIEGFAKISREQMKPNTSNNDEHSREQELKETIKKLEDMEKPTAYSCRNPQATLLMLQVQAELKGIKQGYTKALENEIDFLEGNDECNCCHKVNYWIRLRIKSLKQEIAKLKESK